MAADDMTSQDAAVIGDDLVEALGFEPITAEASGGADHGSEEREGATSEVAVLDDVMPDEVTSDRSGIDHETGDDIEIIEDTPSEAQSFDSDVDTDLEETTVVEDTVVEETAVEEATVEEAEDDELVSDELELDESVEDSSDLDSSDPKSTDTEAVDEVAVGDTSGEVAETSLFGAPAPAYSWGRQSKKGDEDTSSEDVAVEDSAVEDVAVEESTADDSTVDEVIDDVEEIEPDVEGLLAEDVEDLSEQETVDLADEADESAEPVVFFSNGVDTDTEPISSLEVDHADDVDLSDDLASETDDELIVNEIDGVDRDLETPDLETPDLEAAETTEIDLSDPPPPTSSVNLIDLDRGEDLAVGDRVDDVTEADSSRRPPIDRVETDPPATVAPATETALETAEARVEPATAVPVGRKKLRARKSRRVVRHIDPWSVLTFSVLFHLCFFAALLLASVLVWNAALAAGTIENIENFVRELGDYETFEINSDQVFRAAVLIAGLLTLASSVLVVLLTVVFNLISDLIGGIRVTVIEEETVRIPRRAKK